MAGKTHNISEIQGLIRQAFGDYVTLARDNVKYRWAELTKMGRIYDVGRSLVVMCDVAKNPEKYFSRAATQDEWKQRKQNFCLMHPDMPSTEMYMAYYIVRTPVDILMSRVDKALTGTLYSDYYNLCNAVLNWEYYRTSLTNSGPADVYKRQIISMAKNVRAQADILSSGPILKKLKQIKYSIVR